MKCGAIFSGYDARDYQLVYAAPAKEFPKSFELQMRGIKNQGEVGSCVAHSLSSIIEYYNYHQLKTDEKMSVGYIYGNRQTSEYKGEGMIIRDALEAIRKYGDVKNELCPYNEEVPYAINLFQRLTETLHTEAYPNRISQYCRVFDENAIKSALLAGNPVVMAITWYGDMDVVDGVLTTEGKSNQGGHCMFIYGWDERGWKVQNSWGEEWGNNGTMIVPYDMFIEEFWTVTDNIIENTLVKKPNKAMAKIKNKLNQIFKIK